MTGQTRCGRTSSGDGTACQDPRPPAPGLHDDARPHGGFTLVEIVIAILVVAIALNFSSAIISYGMVGLRMNGNDNVVEAAATREMERLKALPWSAIAAIALYPGFSKDCCTDAAGTTIAGCTTGLEALPDARGRVYVQQDDFDGDAIPDDDIRRITVTVSVYGTTNVLAALIRPFIEWADPSASAAGAAGGESSLRSVWRLTTLIAKNGLAL